MSDEILSQVEDSVEKESQIPAGYQKICLSTRGKYGAPEVLHIRNFSVEEALELGSMAQEEIPVKLTTLLQKLIWEKDVDIKKFYDQEVAELCIHFHEAFYSPVLKDVEYKVTDKDKEWMLKNVYQGKDCAEYQNWLRSIETGQLKPKFEINLAQVRYYKIPDEVKKGIKYSVNGFSCVFQYPRFGDTVLLQKAVKEKFRTQDRQFGPLYEIYKRKQDCETRLRRGENIDIARIPSLDPDDTEAVRKYELEKTAYTISLMKGLYLQNFNGEDVSNVSLSERVEMAKDPRIDFSAYQTISDHFSKLEIGPVPKVSIANPVSGIVEEIDYPFRTLQLISAIQNYRNSNASIEFV